MPSADLDKLERTSEWERTARILDLAPDVLRRLRTPVLESVSQLAPANASGLASLGIRQATAFHPRCKAILRVESGNVSQAEDVDELQAECALAGLAVDAASIHLRLPPAETMEVPLWHLAIECAGIISRILGDVDLLPADPQAAVFANWLAHDARRYERKLLAPDLPANRYFESSSEIAGQSCAIWSALALEHSGKRLRGAKAVVLGTGLIDLQCLRPLERAGVRVIAVADESGAILASDGLCVERLLEFVQSGGLLAEYPGAGHAFHADVLALETDLLLAGRSAEGICEKSAANLRCSVVLETVSRALSSTVREKLASRSLQVLPFAMLSCTRLIPELYRSQASARLEEHHSRLWEDLRAVCARDRIPLDEAVRVFVLQNLAECAGRAKPWMGNAM